MTDSYSISETITFTRTHAVHIAAKVAADLKRMQRFYGEPSDDLIQAYQIEAIELLKGGFLAEVSYGFQRNGYWVVPTLRYTAHNLLYSSVNDDDPGRIFPGANVNGASFWSYLFYTSAWDQLTEVERNRINSSIPIQRIGAPEPPVSGYWSRDLTYSAGGRAFDRASLRNY